MPRERHALELHVVGDGQRVALAQGEDGRRGLVRWHRPRGQPTEIFCDELLGRRGLEVAGHDHRDVRRHVVGREELFDVVDAGGGEVLVRADDRVVVGMARGIHVLRQQQLAPAVRAVLVALAALVLDDVPLQIDFFFGHAVGQRGQPIGIQPQEGLEQVRRTLFVIVGAVGARRRIVLPAGGLHDLVELAVRYAFGPHEHEVLEQVSEAALAGDLLFGADVHPGVDDDGRRVVILVEYHREPIGQGVLLEDRVQRGCGARGARQEQRAERERRHLYDRRRGHETF